MHKKLFGVAGNPILHSKSPNIFNSAFKHVGIDAKYIRIAADSAYEAVKIFKDLGIKGMSVTAPFKTEIMQYLDKIDTAALDIGSVNTVVNRDGKLYGYNTDFLGVVNSLPELKGKKCLVLGAGGAGKAACYGLVKYGADVTIINRTKSKAEEIAAKFNCKCGEVELIGDYMTEVDIVVNTVSEKIKLIDDSLVKSNHIILDAIYKNSVYKDIKKKFGATFIAGEDWLVNQAVPAFKHFTGVEINKEALSSGLSKKTSNKIALMGFMGVGKSTIGEELAKRLNYSFFDTDDIIEKQSGMSINEIFKLNGEEYFRSIETKALKEIPTDDKCIVSLGGGVILDKNNRKFLEDNYTTIWLYASLDSIRARVDADTRPLIADNDDMIEDILNKRVPLYAETTDMVVNTDGKNIEEITEKIYEEISKVFGN